MPAVSLRVRGRTFRLEVSADAADVRILVDGVELVATSLDDPWTVVEEVPAAPVPLPERAEPAPVAAAASASSVEERLSQLAVGLRSVTASGEFPAYTANGRCRRAWEAGVQAKLVERGAQQRVVPAPRISLGSTCYAVLDNCSGAALFHQGSYQGLRSRLASNADGTLRDDVILHGFPSRAEAQALFLGATGSTTLP